MKAWFSKHLFKIVCFALVVVGAVFIVTTALMNQNGAALPSGSVSPSPSPSSDEGEGHEHEEDVLLDSIDLSEESEMTCESHLATDEYLDFVQRIRNYEQAFQSPRSQATSDTLKELTTSGYQAAHDSAVQDSTDTLVELLWGKTIVLCNVSDDGSFLVSVRPTIKTSFINEAGEEEVIFPELQLHETHYSVWTYDNGSWKVSEEY